MNLISTPLVTPPRSRITGWLPAIHAKARSGNKWRLAWYPLMFFNFLHVLWPIGLTALEVRKGTAGFAALMLTVPQSVASGFLWNNGLRLSLLAVMHFSRMHTICREMTFLIATHLRLPTEAGAAVGDGVEGGGEVIDADTVRDWWRLRVLLISASTAFSSLYWLHFSGMLIGNVALSMFLLPYMALYGEHLQMRYVLPLALNNLAMVLSIAGVLYFCLLANDESEKQRRALAARRVELWVNCEKASCEVDKGMKILMRQLEVNPLGQHRLLGLLPITSNLMVKMMTFLSTGPVAFLVRAASRTRLQRASSGESFF